jgi:hypothetical protein
MDAVLLTIPQLIEFSFAVRPFRIAIPIVGDLPEERTSTEPFAGDIRPIAILVG